MDIKELKQNLNNYSQIDSLLIFRYADNKEKENNIFLCLQYIKEISRINNLEINYIDNLSNCLVDDDFYNFSSDLNVLIIEPDKKFEECCKDYSKYKKCIIICKAIDENLEPILSKYIIDFPILEDWQIKDYIKAYYPKETNQNIDWFYNVCNGNIFRIDNELNKLKEIDKNLVEIRNENYLYFYDNFFLENALLNYNHKEIYEYLKTDELEKISPLVFISQLRDKYKQIALVKFNSGYSSEQLLENKIVKSEKHLEFIKRNYNHLSSIKIKNILQFLISVTIKIKSSYFYMNSIGEENKITNKYIITNLLNIIKENI
jgi:hypothetical protein